MNRTYQVKDQASFVAVSQCINTHYSSMPAPARPYGVNLTVSVPSEGSCDALDSIVKAVMTANPHLFAVQIERGESHIKVEKESTYGTPVAPQRRWTTKPLDIQPAPDPAAASKMTDQIAAIWPNLEPLEQRMTLAELMKNTPMTRAEIQAQITGLIERLVDEGVKERTQS